MNFQLHVLENHFQFPVVEFSVTSTWNFSYTYNLIELEFSRIS